MVTDQKLASLVHEMRRVGGDLQDVEVKSSVGRLSKSLPETLSAFANGSGGVVILGLSESDGFVPAMGFDAHGAFDALAGFCSDHLVPPVRADIRIASFEGALVVVAEIPETPPFEKPCYVKDRGQYRGSFIRTGDGDRLLTQYEVDRLTEDRRQPRYDLEVVDGATLGDLDASLVDETIARMRARQSRIFGSLSREEALAALNVIAVKPDGTAGITLGGLLALGIYPQRFFPRLTVTFASFPGISKADADGVKYSDSQSMAGPIPVVLMDTVDAVRRNMRTGGVLVGGLRRDVPDYPPDAVREAVCNALMHRDYSPMGRGAQVQVNLYSDRLEVLSPGGLYGAVTVDTLGELGASSTRNQHLSALLEVVPYPGEGGYVAENRGTGFQLIERSLADAGMEPPVVSDRPSLFSLTLMRRPDALAAKGVQGVEERATSATTKGPGAPESALSRVKACLADGEPHRTSDVMEQTGLSRAAVVKSLNKLIEQGVAEVVPGRSASKLSPQRAYRLV